MNIVSQDIGGGLLEMAVFLDRKSEYSYGYGGVTKGELGSVNPWNTNAIYDTLIQHS